MYAVLSQASRFVRPPQEAYLLVATETEPAEWLEPIREQLFDLDPRVPLADGANFSEIIREVTNKERFALLFLTAFGILTLALALFGIYGLASFLVSYRTRDYCIEIALGARPRQILSKVIKRTVALVALGLMFGLVAVGAVTDLVSTFLFGVGATDPSTYLVVAAIFIVFGVVATYLPARRILVADPTEVVRGS